MQEQNSLWAFFAFAVVVSALIAGIASGVSVYVWQNNQEALGAVQAELDIASCESDLENLALRLEMVNTELTLCKEANE